MRRAVGGRLRFFPRHFTEGVTSSLEPRTQPESVTRRNFRERPLSLEIGEHLHLHLGHLGATERRSYAAAIHTGVAVNRVRRAAFALQLNDPRIEQLIDRCPGSGVLAHGHFDDQRRPALRASRSVPRNVRLTRR
jgi:hypothetical protein